MKLGTTYICVSDINRSLNFYRELLQKEPLFANEDRWITFDCGNYLSLYNRVYDERKMDEKPDCFNQAYKDEFYRDLSEKKNNMVIFNFEVDNLKKEYERIQRLNFPVSEILYVNIHMPYWYFNVTDPDGNILEITGYYQ